ncbi:f975aa14-f828-4175-9739-eb504c67bbf9-CDS [Sclerotinia trifoliorum]|uniref:F975aa14-f828-4175-9739-eb504c67bbf9-CDS n=1 Tax=Sclerotinia trifoliorum TaxID=28548 RepID=A0A8H2VWF2_9HELO|nr:f975aa14-f828-4175-9739-eb504c67bbf9-CDS [Sclerotinia trifoliorum]
MCLTIKYIYTCGHAAYHPTQPCSPTSSALNCPDQEYQELDMSRMCNKCLGDRGAAFEIAGAGERRLEVGVRSRMGIADRGRLQREVERQRREENGESVRNGRNGRNGTVRNGRNRTVRNLQKKRKIEKEAGCCGVM